MGRIRINQRYCKGCGICIEYCPMRVFEEAEEPNERGYFVPVVAHPERCTLLKVSRHLGRRACGLCQEMCPDFAIDIDVHAEDEEE